MFIAQRGGGGALVWTPGPVGLHLEGPCSLGGCCRASSGSAGSRLSPLAPYDDTAGLLHGSEGGGGGGGGGGWRIGRRRTRQIVSLSYSAALFCGVRAGSPLRAAGVFLLRSPRRLFL